MFYRSLIHFIPTLLNFETFWNFSSMILYIDWIWDTWMKYLYPISAQQCWGNSTSVQSVQEMGSHTSTCQEGETFAQVGLESITSNRQRVSMELNVDQDVSCWVLDLLRICCSFLLSCLSQLEWECPIYACPTTVFWKHIIYFISPVHT